VLFSKPIKEISRVKRPTGRPLLRWTDQIQKDTGLPMETAERRTMNGEEWRGGNRTRARGTTA